MGIEDDTVDGDEFRCRVAEVRDHGVLLDPGGGRARFVLPLGMVPDEVEAGDRVSVRARHTPSGAADGSDPTGTDVSEIFDEALDALEDIESGWGRPGTPTDSSAA